MKRKLGIGFTGLVVLVCALLLVLAPTALAACKDSEGNKYEEHDWGEWEVTKEPTCKKEGTKVRVCARCGKEKEESIDALGHDWGDWQVTKEATCEKEGTQVRSCSRCGAEKEESIDATGHSWSDWQVTKDPTCEKEGKQVRSCSNCGKEEEKSIDATGHSWSDWQVTKDATCEKEGKQVRSCSNCGKEEEKSIDATGHSWSDWQVTKDATCEEAGKQVRSCSNCGKEEEKGIDATGHSWSEWSTVQDATCEAAGKQVRSCSNCGKEEGKGIDATGHSWSDWSTVQDATCEAAGKQARTCANCGKQEEKSIDATGHSWGEWGTIQEPTCEAAGKQARTCANCGKQEEKAIDALGHDYVMTETPATCEKAGVKTFTCSRCGNTYTEAGAQALGHEWSEWTVVEPEEGVAGSRTRSCARCGIEEAEVIPALETAAEPHYIKFKCGDGAENVPADIVHVEGDDLTGFDLSTVKQPTRAGYTFVRWQLPEGMDKLPNTMPDADIEITAVWQLNVYIRFKCGDGAENVPADIVHVEGDDLTGFDLSTVQKPTRTGYTFVEWRLPAGMDKLPNTMPNADIEITAVWRANVKQMDPLAPVQCHVFKPALADAKKLLPATAKVTLADGTVIEKATLVWSEDSTPAYGDAVADVSGNGTYKFTVTAVRDQADVAYALNGDVANTCDLVIGPATSGDYEYMLDADGKATITAWKGTVGADGILQIAAKMVDGDKSYDVVAIGNAAFKDKTTLKEIDFTLMTGLKAIGDSAFQNCSGLNYLEIPAGVRTIGSSAFADCAALIGLTLPDSLNMKTVPADIVLNDTALSTLRLSVSLATTLTSNVKYTRARLEDEPGEGQITVTLPMALTDLTVYSASFAMNCPFTVDAGHMISVMPGATMNAASDIVNDGDILVTGNLNLNGGKLSNSGTIDVVGGAMKLASSCTLTNQSDGIINVNAKGSLTLSSKTATNNGAIIVDGGGTVDVSSGCTLDNQSDGAINVNAKGSLTLSSKTATNNGTITVDGGSLDVASGCTLTNLGTVSFKNKGKATCSGKIITCGGTWSNKPTVKDGGSYVTEHSYDKNGKCTVCGAVKEIPITNLSASYSGATLSKTYDKTTSIQNTNGEWLINTPKKSDFKLSFEKNADPDHKSVSIKTISIGKFSKADAGSHKLTAKVYLEGDDLKYFKGYNEDSRGKYISVSVPAEIKKKVVTVTPYADLKKYYGAADPTNLGLSCKVTGLLALTKEEEAAGKKLYTGKMEREKGENVGKYKYLIGTLDFGNTNYEVDLKSEVFTIEPMPLNDTRVGLVTIGNQKYTGKAITPDITLRYGTVTLKQGTDFKAEFSDNTKPGTAKVKLTGIGNYTGERTTTFMILNVTSDFGGSGSSSGSYSHSGFDDGEFEETEDGDGFFDEDGNPVASGSDDASGVGRLVLNEVDYGTILFGDRNQAMPFITFEDQDDLGQTMLTIIPDPMVDPETGENVLLENTTRERYPELHLRLSMSTIQALRELQVTEIIYELEQANLHIPLASLVDEIPLEVAAATEETAPADEAIGETVDVEADANADAELDDEDVIELEEDSEVVENVDSMGEFDLTAAVMQVSSYDIQLEQADANGLTERETITLEGSELMTPAYRVRVRVIPVGEEPVPAEADGSEADVEATADDASLTEEEALPEDALPEAQPQPVGEPLPEGYFLENVVLHLVPNDNLVKAPEGAQVIRVPFDEPTEEDALTAEDEPTEEDELTDESEEIEFTPAVFTDVEGTLSVETVLQAEGMYAVAAPEGWDPAQYIAEPTEDSLEEGGDDGEADAFFDEEFEDEEADGADDIGDFEEEI